VLDLSQGIAGPYCAALLAQQGADVIKAEPMAGDWIRSAGGGREGMTAVAVASNLGKRSIALDATKPSGRELLARLAARADVVVQNYRPGVIERLGLGYEAVKEINPGIIYCRIKGFSPGSPHEKGLAFDMIAQAAGGPISVTGYPDQPPVKPGLSFGDTGTGMLMAATILGALHERNRTGQGRLLELAMQEAMIHYMRTCFATMMRTGKPATRRGAKPSAGNNAPAGLYPCKGGGPNDYLYLTTSRANPEHYSRLMKLIGREDLIEDPRFANGDVRVKNSDELDRIIGQWTKQHDKRDAMEKLIAIGVPAGAVFDTLELQNEPYFEESGFMQHVQHHNGEDKMASWPVRIDGKRIRLKGAPALGGDTADVLQSWLGIDDGEFANLKTGGVL
jgi:formyl-CoA transferase